MKQNKTIHRALFLLALPLLAGCASTKKQTVTVEPVRTLTADAQSKVNLDLTFRIPHEILKKRNRIIVVPQLVRRDSVLDEYRPLVLDAPIYARKLHRKQVLSQYVDDYLQYAQLKGDVEQDKNTKEYLLPYNEEVTLPKHYTGSRIVAMLSTDGCGECSLIDTIDMAYFSTTYELLPNEAMKYNYLQPKFVIRPKIAKGEGEARLQFKINLYNIDLDLHRNREEITAMMDVLGKIVNDSLATLNSFDIYGVASADGSYAFNTTLSANRAASAKQWLIQNLHLNHNLAKRFSVGSMPEGWAPVLEAMRADKHPDTLKVAEIMEKYKDENDDVAERYIRRLACWNDIKNKYLQKDRRVVYKYAYTLKSFTTDAEMLSIYETRPDAFNEEELLRVSTLKQEPAAKKEVYHTILKYFPNSHVAANNLAILLIQEGRYEEAAQMLAKVSGSQPELIHMQGTVQALMGNYQQADELLSRNAQVGESRYNLGVVKARRFQFAQAYELLKEYNDVPAAIVSLCVDNNQHALRQMNDCNDTTPLAEYVRAVIYARLQQKAEMLKHLQLAVADAKLRERAAIDADFKAYQGDADFLQLTGNGGANK